MPATVGRRRPRRKGVLASRPPGGCSRKGHDLGKQLGLRPGPCGPILHRRGVRDVSLLASGANPTNEMRGGISVKAARLCVLGAPEELQPEQFLTTAPATEGARA